MSVGLVFESKKRFLSSIKEKKLINVVNKLTSFYFFKIYQFDDVLTLDFSYSGLLNIMLENGVVKGEFSNNIGGPGVHKEVVNFLDELSRELNVELFVEDETDYWNNRNFSLLKDVYISFLQMLLKGVYEQTLNSEYIYFLLCWPFNWFPSNTVGFITPIGVFNRDDIKKVIDNNDFLKFGETFFIWHNEVKDDLYHKQMALYLMWSECYWVKPRTNEEHQVVKRILYHSEKAIELNSNLELPLDAIKDIELLSENNSQALSKIGYRRNNIVVRFPGEFEVILPGSFIESNENDDHVFWGDNRNFRLSAYDLNEEYESKILKNCDSQEEIINEILNGVRYIGKLSKEEDFWYLQGEILYKNILAIVTITFSTPEYKDWAILTFKNIKNQNNK